MEIPIIVADFIGVPIFDYFFSLCIAITVIFIIPAAAVKLIKEA